MIQFACIIYGVCCTSVVAWDICWYFYTDFCVFPSAPRFEMNSAVFVLKLLKTGHFSGYVHLEVLSCLYDNFHHATTSSRSADHIAVSIYMAM